MERFSPDVFGLPELHLVTSDVVLGGDSFLEDAERILDVGGRRVALHVRGRKRSSRELWRIADRVAGIAARSGSWIIVNDRIDLALSIGAHGVQLGRDSFDLPTARRLLGDERVIGASIHDVPAGQEAARSGADFLLAGTLYESRSHPGRRGSGCGWLGELRSLGLPVIGIGGVTVDRVDEVLEAGAAGIAVISGVWDARDPAYEVERYLSKLGGWDG